jgi:hypothetical protein
MKKQQTIGGIPVITIDSMPKDEIWFGTPGESHTAKIHEGPTAGQFINTVLRKPQVVRITKLKSEAR